MEEKERKFEIDGNAIVSPKNTKKLYGNKKLEAEELEVEPAGESGITLPDDRDENMFPSAA